LRIGQLILLTSLLTGCSLYRSDGRIYLENNGVQLANIAVANGDFAGCSKQPPTTDWVPFENNDEASVFSAENGEFDLRVVRTSDPEYSFYFHFTSAQEMYAKSASAIDISLHQSLASCQGRFAFLPASNLK
jgi:hypothetical protein